MNATSARLAQGFSNIGHSYSHIFMLLYPTVVLALESELGRSYGELLVLMTVGNVLFGVGALPAGWLGDRWSATRMMVVFFIGMGAASIATGLTSSSLGLTLGLALIGLFASIYHPVGMAWLVRNATHRGRALGFNGVFGSLGLASAALIAGTLTDLIHWRAAFLVPGGVSVLTGLALGLCLRLRIVADTPVDRKPEAPPPRRSMVRAFVILSLTMLCSGLIYQSTAVALPKVFAERLPALTGGTPAGAGLLVSIVYLCAVTAQLVGGHLADRYALRWVYLAVYLFQAPLWWLAAVASGLPLLVITTAAVLLNTSAIPVENTLLSHYSPEKWRGTAFGAKFVLALGVSALGVPLVAFIHQATGAFYAFFLLLALLAGVIAAAAFWLPPAPRRETTAVAPAMD